MSVKYRPHRGSLAAAMAEVVEVQDFVGLVNHMRSEVVSYYPSHRLPTIETTEVKPYAYDSRIGWDTYMVTVDGQAWGFTNGPLAKPGASS